MKDDPKDDKKKKYGIHAGPPLRRLIEERAGPDRTPTGVVNTTAARYLALLDRSAPRLTLAEWGQVIAALRGRSRWPDAPELAALWREGSVVRALAAEAGRIENGAASGAALLAKLHRLSDAETLAVVEIVERYGSTRDPNRPLAEALARLGADIES